MERMQKRDEFVAEEVRQLVLNITYGECRVIEAPEEQIVVEAYIDVENAEKYNCTLNGGVLRIDTGNMNKRISITDKEKQRLEKQEVIVTVPCGIKLESLQLCVGVGTAKLQNTSSVYGSAKLEIGAGKLDADVLMIENGVELEVGAGKADIRNLNAATAELECGVGRMSVEGAIDGDIHMECGVGSIEMILDATEFDYNYDIDCGIGSVYINGSKRGGIFVAKADMLHVGAKGTMKLECGVGKIELVTRKRISSVCEE